VSPLQALLVLVAGFAAGAINTIVGSGTLITFPVLLGVGYSPITANVSNSLGLAPGSLSGAYGYRRELAGQRNRVIRYAIGSLLGGITGAALLFVLPSSAFEVIVPPLIALALVLVILQPRLASWLEQRRHPHRHADGGPVAIAVGFLCGVYGGYFGAGQGIVLLAVFGLSIDDDMQRLNGLKNVLVMLVNVIAGVIFLFVAHVTWLAVALLAVGSASGGQLGAKIGRRLPPNALRALIVVVGVVAIVQLLTR
jgi:uncharacterized membrane protein YfcA